MDMTGQEPCIDLPRMHDNLMLYMDHRIIDDQCRMCRRLFRLCERAEHAVDMEDERAFRRSRSKILNMIADHEIKTLKLLLDDTTPQSKFYNHDSVLNNKREEIEGCHVR